MTQKTILMTGVAGFLGSNLLQRLISEGHKVVGIDNLSMGHTSNFGDAADSENFRFIEADAMYKSTFDDIKDEIDVAVHLAAFKIPRYGNAIDTLKINYGCTENILEFCRERQIKCVLASTSDVYGNNPDVPFSEEHTKHVIGNSKSPRWSYAVSKLFDEHLALAYQDSYGFPVTLLRFFGSYGPNQALSWWGGPPPVFINSVLNDEIIPIHGDGMQTRSFTYVEDTVNGIFESIMRDEANGEILNIGGSEEITILELAKRVKQASGTPGELKYELVPYESFSGKKYEDVMRRVPDTTFSEKILGVKARIGVDEGLKRTIAWQIEATKTRPFGMNND